MKNKSFKKIIPYLAAGVVALVCIASAALYLNAGRAGKVRTDIVIFGDSLMAYAQDETSVASLLAEKTGLKVTDLSFGGTLMSDNPETETLGSHRNYLSMYTIARSFYMDDFSVPRNIRTTEPATDYFDERIRAMESLDLADTDTVIIDHCLNDYHCGIPIGTPDDKDEYTYCGAFRSVTGFLKSVNPDIRIIVLSPTQKWTVEGVSAEEIDYGGGTLDAYVRAQKEMAEVLGLEYIDIYGLYDETYLTPEGEEITGYSYTVEGTHPDFYGRDAISSAIAEYLKETDR